LVLSGCQAFAQTPLLRVKVRHDAVNAARQAALHRSENVSPFVSRHMIVQFDGPPSAATTAALTARGVAVLQDVPDNALLVRMDGRVSLDGLGVRYAEPIDAEDKISPLIVREMSSPLIVKGGAAGGYYLVEFHPDVDMNFARGLVLNSGLELRENPDLGRHQLMVRTDPKHALIALSWLAERDEVAYIFPASQDLAAGRPVAACEGALTANGALGQYVVADGDGWDGPGQNAATVNYFFSQMTAQLATGVPQAEVLRAMAEWSKVVQIDWQPGTSATGLRTVNVLFARGVHGDGFPFDGPGGVLAHTFYPAPPNPESIAGDVHLDDDEAWRVGTNYDLFSVALHELGHALGLGHSDDPNAVMYPYYRIVTGLSDDDKNAILSLYAAAQPGSPTSPPSSPGSPAPPPPLVLTVNVPPATTAAASVSLSGSVSGGSGTKTVSWQTGSGASGLAVLNGSNWSAANIPLVEGVNNITVTAADGSGSVARTVTVTRQTAATPPPNPSDKTPPTLTITSPASTSVYTTLASLNFKGTASDSSGVASVTWSTNTGSSGTAAGTTQWSATAPLLVGSNQVTIRATDAAGNTSWRTIVVTRR
jgi:Matrixin/Bacterial Ig domain